ncbi:MAG: DUF1598 domain-containing protein, partial [Thermoguttaceae bacterium]|nr:DUF1598 domain-containing protein [Thermoguttaceae bacterium]
DDEEDERRDRRYLAWGYRSAVGGFMIDAGHVLRTATHQENSSLTNDLQGRLQAIPADLDQATPVRKISLRRLNQLLIDCQAKNEMIPDSARYLGGLTAIDYVVAVPEENDIYLVGPAEGWKVTSNGNVVGKTSGKPVLYLEDLLTVMRAWDTQSPELISCSIDPTQEGAVRMADVVNQVDVFNAEALQLANAEAMGMMDITFTGIPESSRMASVLVAADYRMKQLSLGFDKSALKGFNSYFSMIKKGSKNAYGQRFWIEPAYNTVYHDSDNLTWNVSESKINTLTEREYFDQQGNRSASGKVDAAAEKWARTMTQRYSELSDVEPVFAEAKNCMDIALVVALIYAQNLKQAVHANFDALENKNVLLLPKYDSPKQVESQSLVRISQKASLAVTGGILVNPWETVTKDLELDSRLNDFRNSVVFAGDNWYAN